MLNELSIEQVITSYARTVYGVAITHTTSRADADDVFQEVFAAYWRTKPTLSSEEHRKAWLIRTALNFSLKITQSSWAKKTVYAEGEREMSPEDGGQSELGSWTAANPEASITDFTFQTEQQMALYSAMSSLSMNYRSVVLLFYFEDLSIAQIAALLDEEQGAIKTRLSRARAQLREKMKEGV